MVSGSHTAPSTLVQEDEYETTSVRSQRADPAMTGATLTQLARWSMLDGLCPTKEF